MPIATGTFSLCPGDRSYQIFFNLCIIWLRACDDPAPYCFFLSFQANTDMISRLHRQGFLTIIVPSERIFHARSRSIARITWVSSGVKSPCTSASSHCLVNRINELVYLGDDRLPLWDIGFLIVSTCNSHFYYVPNPPPVACTM